MIKEHAKSIMQKLNFSKNAEAELLCNLDYILRNEQYSKIFLDAINLYDTDEFDFLKTIDSIKALALNADICVYTAYMLFFICLIPKLHNRYIQKGIDDKIFYDTIADLKYKLDECALVHGKIGTFVPAWYKGIFEMRIFALGRLQFEINHIWFECTVKNQHIPKGTKVLSVHIPRTGTRLDHTLVTESYNMACKFFRTEFDGNIVFVCNSWLLYPWNRSVLKDESNLALFYDDFTIVSSGEYSNYSECWRLFDCLYDGNADNLPADSSLRRAYIERIKSCQPIGHGTGVIVFTWR